jgi:hypothetical protein
MSKTVEELESFVEAQQKVIIQLNKKIQKLEYENNSLKDKTKNQPSPLLKDLVISDNTSSEESICLMQIELLKQTSLGRELTLEETRKLETFTKILQSLKLRDKSKDNIREVIETKDLLKLVESDDGSN